MLDEHDEASENLLAEIETALRKEEIKLPAIPDVAMKIRAAFKDEQYDVGQIAKLVQTEAGLTAYILKVANSPLHRGPIPIKTAKHAICRLGQHSVQSIVLSYTVKCLFKAPSAKLKELLQEQWHQSTSIAAISAILAQRCEDYDSDQALLAGLLQDIGCLPLIEWLKNNHPKEAGIKEEFELLKSRYAAQIGEMILASWKFDSDLIEVVKSRENWKRNSNAVFDTADIVTIARHHYYLGNGLQKLCPKITEIEAYHKMPFQELTPDESLAILEESKEEIAEMKKMLMSE